MIHEEDFLSPWDKAQRCAKLAHELYESGDIEQAIGMLDAALEIDPENASLYFNKGLAYEAIDCFDDAIEQHQRALEIAPDDLEVLNALALDYTRNGEFDRSLEIFEYIERLDNNYEPCYCNRIITYTELNKHEKAEEMFYLAQQIDPDCPLCFYNIGNSLYSRAAFDRAIWCWEKVRELDANHPQINYRIGQAYWATGNTKMAQRYFEEELRNDPSAIDVLLDMAVVLLEQGQTDAARDELVNILDRDAMNAAALFYLGESYLFDSKIQEARKYYQDVLKLDSYMSGPRYRLAQIAMSDGDEKLVASLLKSELELDIQNPEIFLSIGTMLLKVGVVEHAIHSFLQVIDIDSKNIKAYQYLSRSLHAIGQHEDALQFLEYALALDQDNPSLHLDAALLYLEMGFALEAKEHLDKASLLWPENVKLNEIRAEVEKALASKS